MRTRRGRTNPDDRDRGARMREHSAVTHGGADSEAAVRAMTVVVTEDSQHHLSRTRLLYNVIVATDWDHPTK